MSDASFRFKEAHDKIQFLWAIPIIKNKGQQRYVDLKRLQLELINYMNDSLGS